MSENNSLDYPVIVGYPKTNENKTNDYASRTKLYKDCIEAIKMSEDNPHGASYILADDVDDYAKTIVGTYTLFSWVVELVKKSVEFTYNNKDLDLKEIEKLIWLDVKE